MSTQQVHLAFVTHRSQAAWLRARWSGLPGRRVLICLDEAPYPVAEASADLGPGVEPIGLSELNLSPREILERALSVAEGLFPVGEGPLAARVDRWMMETQRRRLIHGVHSLRAIESAIERFQASHIWIPPCPDMAVTTTPDQDPENPLFFDLLAVEARRRGLRVEGRRGSPFDPLWRLVMPVKYLLGQWVSEGLKGTSPSREVPRRPVLLSNLDNDFHRQFDPIRLGPVAHLMLAWIRAGEWMVPVDALLGQVAPPATTGLAWLRGSASEIRKIATPAGAGTRPLAGLTYLFSLARYRVREGPRRLQLAREHGLGDGLLLGRGLSSIHAECQLAGAFYCVLEYERALSVLQKWRPRLFVTSADHWSYRPQLAAARDLGISTLATTSGISFLRDDLVERVADVVSTYGPAEAERLSRQQPPPGRIVQAGDVLSSWQAPAGVPEVPARRVLVATSARPYGWWFGSLFLDAPAYLASLRSFIERLRRLQPPVQALIKSHPLYDHHDLYERLVAEEPGPALGHRKEPLSVPEMAGFGAAVVFSTATTLTAELVRARVPIVFFSGALTPLGRDNVDYRELLEATDPPEAVRQVARLLDPGQSAFRSDTLGRGEALLRRYLTDRPRSFAWVLGETMETEARITASR